MDPQQELFSELLTTLKTNYDVYDGALPALDVPYPFIYMGASRLLDDYGNKTQVLGTVYQTIDVWHNDTTKRGTLSALLLAVKQAARDIGYTTNFAWRIKNITQNILTDSTTTTPLMHGVLDLEFRFSERKK